MILPLSTEVEISIRMQTVCREWRRKAHHATVPLQVVMLKTYPAAVALTVSEFISNGNVFRMMSMM